MYNRQGSLQYNRQRFTSEYRWYISNTNNSEYVEGDIRSVFSGQIIYTKLEWEYITASPQCATVSVLPQYENTVIDKLVIFHFFSGPEIGAEVNKSCIFPFKMLGRTYYGCLYGDSEVF